MNFNFVTTCLQSSPVYREHTSFFAHRARCLAILQIGSSNEETQSELGMVSTSGYIAPSEVTDLTAAPSLRFDGSDSMKDQQGLHVRAT